VPTLIRLALCLIALSLTPPVMAFATPSRSEVENMFRSWLEKDVWPQASKAGVSRSAFDKALGGAALDWSLPDLAPPGTRPPAEQAQSQAEFRAPAAYFNEKRLQDLASRGRALASEHGALLRRIETRFGVPGPIILAIWGRESGYGAAKLPYSAINVLATKAFMSTRREMFRDELLAALHIIETGDVQPADMRSSWAGALGQPQFMPSSFLRHAIDFDGDGHRDIWHSPADILASIANYLALSGWQRGRDWGFEVTIPGSVRCAQEGPDRARPIDQWLQSGIGRISGKPFPAPERGASGMMLMPAGTHGPQFIVTPNFYVLKNYNNSDLYALFIGNLADRIGAGGAAFKGDWGDVGRMLRSDVLAMQQALVKKGYDVGAVDGLPGFKTRRSLGEWQARNGLMATCYPDQTLKARLK
jgi:lytic murein transglycosylase